MSDGVLLHAQHDAVLCRLQDIHCLVMCHVNHGLAVHLEGVGKQNKSIPRLRGGHGEILTRNGYHWWYSMW